MLKIETNSNKNISYLVFCSAFYTFSTYIQTEKYNVKSWCFTLIIDFLLSLLILSGTKSIKNYSLPLKAFAVFFFSFAVARQILSFYNFLSIYYNENSVVSCMVLSICVLLFYATTDVNNIFKMSKLLFSMCIIFVLIMAFSNASKFTPINLFSENGKIENIKISFLDWIIPYSILKDENEKYYKISFIYMIFVFISITSFSLIAGNILYAVNPVQIFLLVSSGKLVKSYDGIITFLLYFLFTAMLLLNLSAYSKMNISKKFIFLLIVPALFLNKFFEKYILPIQVVFVFLLAINGVTSNEKA